ncbi:pantothenate permease [Salinisphaera orenii MK-B5]|uniref:Pantothenate permease n=2 Tax=Salinisphaera orenii TaxID=856731 RepID=A0A423PKS3_9GAMM|nr:MULTISPECIES: sodium:solute symporter family protein [Salinisphaera]ROO26204.1 pantothenate permease [Salinisphaera orenii MK-B5]ROO34938.1 pantothenate permease [Salinisphaera halophila YIM 95161]
MSSGLIWLAIGLYLLIALVTAWAARSGAASDMSAYFLGGRRMGGIVSALSYSATTYSAFMLVGLAGLTYAGGIGAFGFEIVYFAGVSLISVFGPRFWAVGRRYGFVTPSEMLGYRYQSRAVSVVVTLTSCLFLIPYAAVQLAGVGYLLSGMTDGAISFTTGTVVATTLAVVFTWISGIRSVMWTDALQAAFMIVAATLVAIVVVEALGGFGALFASLARDHPEMLAVPGNGRFTLLTFIGLTMPWFFFSLSNPQVSQRLFMPASLTAMRRLILGFMVFGLIYTLVAVIWGLAAVVAFPGLANADQATPTLLASDYVPPVLGVIVMVGILAAAVSTIDSIMLTLSAMLARDVYANRRITVSESAQLKVGQRVIPVIALAAFLFAELQLDLIVILSVAASSGLVVVVPAIIGAFFWRRGTAAGVLASMIITGLGVLVSELSGVDFFGLPSGVWGLPMSTLIFVGVSLATRAPTSVTEAFMACANGDQSTLPDFDRDGCPSAWRRSDNSTQAR